ncbi:MAG: hypothetical protein ABI045_03945 [Flavobacteriales bacterium]
MTFFSAKCQGNITKQAAAIEDLIAKDIYILIINTFNHKALVLAINSTAKLGIPIVIVESYIHPEANYITSVQANNLGNEKSIGK